MIRGSSLGLENTSKPAATRLDIVTQPYSLSEALFDKYPKITHPGPKKAININWPFIATNVPGPGIVAIESPKKSIKMMKSKALESGLLVGLSRHHAKSKGTKMKMNRTR